MTPLPSLSLEQLAGQRLMVGFNGIAFDSDLAHLIGTLKVGGLILFRRNIGTPEEIRQLCRQAQAHAAACGQPPLLIGIDQEGGEVARLKKPFTEFSGQPAMKTESDVTGFARVCVAELLGVGINMNFSPVLDVAPREIRSIMAGRSFGPDPVHVARMGEILIGSLQENGVMAVAKHFPGIGRTCLDSHVDLPSLDTSLEELESFDLLPFSRAVAADVAGIMLSHIHYPQLDPEWPASLSPAIAKDLLRGRLHYRGVVMTDDLDMGAIERHFGFDQAVRQVLSADIDLMLICHRSEKIEMAHKAIRTWLAASPEARLRGSASVGRILALKRRYRPRS
jgi:beta-N-acetylhexosaminidase